MFCYFGMNDQIHAQHCLCARLSQLGLVGPTADKRCILSWRRHPSSSDV